jgi:hypothetical protein
MVRVITAGETARVVLAERSASGARDVGDVVAGVRHCADIGVEELVIALPELERGWLEDLEVALRETPDPLRIWVAVGDAERGDPAVATV